jgi:hypothetical protein
MKQNIYMQRGRERERVRERGKTRDSRTLRNSEADIFFGQTAGLIDISICYVYII